jgi:hypothetical protein
MARILLPVLKENQVGCPPTGNVLVPTERMSTAFAHELLTAFVGHGKADAKRIAGEK